MSTLLTPPAETTTPVDWFLREQQRLTAVERFAEWHDRDAPPAQAKHYTALLPATPPGPGEQYAFEVDLDACSGCKACVTACHQLNGLDPGESFRDVGLLHGGSDLLPVLQHVTTACHHCLDPACLNVCPVDAYEKHPDTGIVRHLDDQCIGCRYCTLACPYDVPKYNHARGIVRKCDMCSQRLAAGEAPACVQACPHQAIRIRLVDRQSVVDDCETNQFLPGAPEPRQTLPTTVFKTRRVLPRNLLPADYYAVRPEHAHWPLVWMLVLTQLSVGAFLVDYVWPLLVGRPGDGALHAVQAATALASGLLALAASTLHLGRPLYAFRAVVGLRHSWLSREIVAFGLYAALASAYAAALWLVPGDASLICALGGSVVWTGLCGVLCSVMIYHRTGREFWHGTATGLKFAATTLLLGLAASLAASTIAAAADGPPARNALALDGPPFCRLLIAVTAAKLACEAMLFLHLGDKQQTPLKRSARLMTGPLRRVTQARYAVACIGGLLIPALLLSAKAFAPTTGFGSVAQLAFVALLLAAAFTGEVLERYLFFTAVASPRMPGGLTT